MKKLVLLVLILVVSFQFVVSQTNPQGHYKIDLKTKFNDKADLKPAKHGFKKILQQQLWCDVGEIGEDFAVWVKSPFRTSQISENGNKEIHFTCKLEIRTKSMFKEGDLISNRAIDFSYEIDKSELDEFGDIKYIDVSKLIESVIETSEKIDNSKAGKSVMAFFDLQSSGGTKVTRELINKSLVLFQPYFSNGEPLEYKAEYYLIGGELLQNLKEMIVELENKSK